ncbi:hypothetical protein [Longimicrobium sp.]|jgi:hypothetical protein|uniref:hypothetical protein n=1 Tax=Longimicrobium sp. TaxID=2029185 RepID=UPI002F949267
MQRPALLMLLVAVGCATRQTPPPAPADEAGKLVRRLEVPSAARKGAAIASFRGTACQTNDRMPIAPGGSLPYTAAIPRSESTGTPVPIPNACPVTARAGRNVKVVEYQRDSANAAPEPPR